MSEIIVSPCGVVCSACRFYPGECAGCPAIEGRVFWLAYTGGAVCDIYQCCVQEKELPHCGLCGRLPCDRYEQQDPTMSPAENEASFRAQMALLQKLASGDVVVSSEDCAEHQPAAEEDHRHAQDDADHRDAQHNAEH